MNLRSKLNPNTEPAERTRIVYQEWREGFVTPLLISTMVLGLFAVVPAVLSSQNIYLAAAFVGVYLIVGVVTFSNYPYSIRAGVFLFTVYALGFIELIFTGILGDGLFFLIIFLTLATMLLSPRAGMGATVINLATFAILATLTLTGTVQPLNPDAMNARLADWLSAAFSTLLFSVAIIMGFRRLEIAFSNAQKQIDESVDELRSERNNLEKNVSDRTRQLRKVNEITRAISSILDPQALLARAVHLISQEFECYHTAIFLLDNTGQWVELREATGDAGRTMRDNKYRLDASGKSLISTAIQQRQPRIALDSGDAPVKFETPLLRYTRSEVILPLLLGDRLVGAIDLQSTKASAFSAEDLDALQNMANQVAIALENARLFREASQSLAEMRATQRQYLGNAWTNFALDQQFEYHLGDSDSTDQTKEVEVPLALRDQIIGQISLSMNEDWTAEQRNLIESIASQAALALENARLVEESQSTAARERLANEIIAKIWASPSVDAIMQTAVRELGRALDASEVNIQISTGEANE